MEQLGIVRRSDSPWASPLHVVPKADGSWRPCGDYRRLNSITEDDRYPLPHLQDFNARLSGMQIFSVIDLVKGFHQIPMSESDIPKTAIITPFGLFEFLRMPFGLKNAAQAFQRLMDGMLRDITFAFVYLDDILVASPDPASHKKHLRELFQLLQDNGVNINRKKCVFGQSEVKYLGHFVSAAGIRPLPDRVSDLIKFPAPTSKAGVQRFLGMLNFYRRFVPNLAASLAPLHSLTSGKKNEAITWSPDCQVSFEAAKKKLAAATLLHHPSPFAATALTVDASETAIGAELSQRGSDHAWKPIAFYSHSLTTPERKYSAFDRELLAAYLSVKHFKHFLEGRKFIIFTDHKPITHALTSNTDNRSPRQTRHLSFISEFTSDIRFIKGERNVVADALSRPPAVPLPAINSAAFPDVPSVDFEAFARDQDPAELLATSSLSLKQIPFRGFKMWWDTSHGLRRPLVPLQFRRRIFDALHGLSHGGTRPTLKLVSTRFVWPGMRKQVREWCHTCLPCQSAKIGRHTKSPVQVIPPAKRRFGSIQVDLVGPLPDSDGCRYLLTIVDRYTRWPEAYPLPDMMSATCAKVFIRQYLPRFGIPDDIITDRGTQFVGGAWKELMNSMGIQSHTTTAYHPQGNGLVERMHRQLKGSLRARLVDSSWQDCLPLVLLGLRSAWREDPDTSPAQMLYGTPLRLPGEFVPSPEFNSLPSSSSFVSEFQARMKVQRPAPSCHHPSKSSTYVPSSLRTATMVLIRHDGVRRPLQKPYDGPFPVLEAGEKSFKVLKNGLPYTCLLYTSPSPRD